MRKVGEIVLISNLTANQANLAANLDQFSAEKGRQEKVLTLKEEQRTT